jgi:hypothetical protein
VVVAGAAVVSVVDVTDASAERRAMEAASSTAVSSFWPTVTPRLSLSPPRPMVTVVVPMTTAATATAAPRTIRRRRRLRVSPTGSEDEPSTPPAKVSSFSGASLAFMGLILRFGRPAAAGH